MSQVTFLEELRYCAQFKEEFDVPDTRYEVNHDGLNHVSTPGHVTPQFSHSDSYCRSLPPIYQRMPQLVILRFLTSLTYKQ